MHAINKTTKQYLLAFDTTNEVIALAIGRLMKDSTSIEVVATREVAAHRASNTQLLPQIQDMLSTYDITQDELACIVCGRGPGSFTGVRICMATAKGIASALELPLIGISTLDAIAWQVFDAGTRGHGLVMGDAMRKEIYPVRYEIDEKGVTRLDADNVIKADDFATQNLKFDWISGDGLLKYEELFAENGRLVAKSLWTPTGKGLLLATQQAWQKGEANPYDAELFDPAFALPVYTRLSDAEENERIRLSKNDPKNLETGVQSEGTRRDQVAVANDTAVMNAKADTHGIVYRPLDAAHVHEVVALEAELMGTDAWTTNLVADELQRKDRVWWAAYAETENEDQSLVKCTEKSMKLVSYAGGWVVDGQVQILKVATAPAYQGRGIARTLLGHLSSDARDLGAKNCTLEVRLSNVKAIAFYATLGFVTVGVRPRYYSDREDAVIMDGPLPLFNNDVAGMEVQVLNEKKPSTFDNQADEGATCAPLILAIETSCDETAAAIIDGKGTLLADVVASQIDFHARFGGVVPEIASRKHVEAICGVTQVAFEKAAENLRVPRLRWADLDGVAVTYAPGLVGALVVGVAFAKGAAWAANIPLVKVNHLEGHIYANKIATPDITPPLVVSLVSGGHTMLMFVKKWGQYETLGSTLDDAVGEAFDKVAKVMGLGYPGGPAISKLAAQGDPNAIDFPRAMLHSGDLRFSLSGLKTAVITYLHKEEQANHTVNKADVAASFQQAVIDVQIAKAKTALLQTGAKEFCLGGGVAANAALREAYEKMCAQINVRLTLPPLSACTDNAGMIALVALDRFRDHNYSGLDTDAFAHANLDEEY